MRVQRLTWQNGFRVISLIIVAVSNLSFATARSSHHLLSEEDLEQELMDAENGPQLNSALNEYPHWESFNEWNCFSTQTVQLECSALDYGQIHVPTLRVTDSGLLYDYSSGNSKNLYEFQMSEEPGLGCKEVLQKWNTLLESERAFCVYSAYLQDLPADHFEAEGVKRWTLSIISQLKTQQGYWREYKPVEDPEEMESDEEALDGSSI